MDSTPLQVVTAALAVVGPFLTYAGVRYQQKDKLEELARKIVADTLSMQAAKISALERAEEEDQRFMHSLRRSYQAIRASLLTVREKTKIIAERIELLFEDLPDHEARLAPVRAGFDSLLTSLDQLAESTDPLETQPGKSSPGDAE